MQPFPTYQNYYNYPTQNLPAQNAPIYPYGQVVQQNNFSNIVGKTVNDFNEITANDVPMDGRVAFFPKSDMSEIAVKNWESNGTIRTMTFKPILSAEGNNLSVEGNKTEFGAFGDVLKGIQNDIKVLAEKVDKISKPSKTVKKENDDE